MGFSKHGVPGPPRVLGLLAAAKPLLTVDPNSRQKNGGNSTLEMNAIVLIVKKNILNIVLLNFYKSLKNKPSIVVYQ